MRNAVKAKREWVAIALVYGFFAIVVAGLIGLWVFASYIEGETFERFTGQKVTIMEAMFSEFRIDCDTVDRSGE